MSEGEALEASTSSSKTPLFKKRGLRAKSGGNAGASRHHQALDKGLRDANEQAEARGGKEGEDDENDGLSLHDLISLRALRNRPSGIDLERLNQGDAKKKSKKKKQENSEQRTEEEKWAEQMQKGGLVQRSTDSGTSRSTAAPSGREAGAQSDNEEESSDSEEEKATSKTPKLVKQNNFQGETGTIDVDKHMMAYIEEEMQKRRQSGDNADASALTKAAAGTLNPNDELYSIAEKYKKIQQSAKEAVEAARRNVNPNAVQKEQDEKEEGNATLSSAMLNGVPEVDLGIDHRMKNIEETERARKAMIEAQLAKEKDVLEDDSDFASARFFKHRSKVQSDADIIRTAESLGHYGDGKGFDDASKRQMEQKLQKRQTATDDAALDRFKKRQRNQLKR